MTYDWTHDRIQTCKDFCDFKKQDGKNKGTLNMGDHGSTFCAKVRA